MAVPSPGGPMPRPPEVAPVASAMRAPVPPTSAFRADVPQGPPRAAAEPPRAQAPAASGGVPPRPWEMRNTNAPALPPAGGPAIPPPLRALSVPPAGATPLSRTTEPAPAVRITNVRKPEPAASLSTEGEDDERLFPEEGSAEGCASGECLPDAAPPEAEPEPEVPMAQAPRSGRDNPSRSTAERWRAAVDSVKSASVRHGAALSHGRLLWLRTGEIGLGYRPQEGFHRLQLTSSTGKGIVDKALAEHFGRPMKLVFEETAGDVATQSIAEEEAHSRAAHEKSTEGKVRSHPAIRSVLKLLGGEVEHIQIYEPERPAVAAPPPSESPEDLN